MEEGGSIAGEHRDADLLLFVQWPLCAQGGVPDPRGTLHSTGLEKGNQCQLLINLPHGWKSTGSENIFMRAEPGKWRCREWWEGSHVFIIKKLNERKGGCYRILVSSCITKTPYSAQKYHIFPQELFTPKTRVPFSWQLNYGEISLSYILF